MDSVGIQKVLIFQILFFLAITEINNNETNLKQSKIFILIKYFKKQRYKNPLLFVFNLKKFRKRECAFKEW